MTFSKLKTKATFKFCQTFLYSSNHITKQMKVEFQTFN